MVMDLVTGGELFDAVAEAGRLPEARARLYFQQLVDGILYCHSRRVYHRDLKPENLLLSEDKQTIKITDFGLSSIKATNTSTELLHTIMGSPHYIAPEIITSAAAGYDGAKVDVWASGIILFGMLAGYLPFDEPQMSELYRSIVHKSIIYPPHFSYDVIKLLRVMLQKDPNKRPTMEQIKQYTWFRVNYSPVSMDDSEIATPTGQRKGRLRNKMRKGADKLSRARRKDSTSKMPSTPTTGSGEGSDMNASSGEVCARDRTHSSKKSSRKSVDSDVSDNRENVDPDLMKCSNSQGSCGSAGLPSQMRIASSDSSKVTSSNLYSAATTAQPDKTPHSLTRPPMLVDTGDHGDDFNINPMDIRNAFVYIETPMASDKQHAFNHPFSTGASFKARRGIEHNKKPGTNVLSEDQLDDKIQEVLPHQSSNELIDSVSSSEPEAHNITNSQAPSHSSQDLRNGPADNFLEPKDVETNAGEKSEDEKNELDDSGNDHEPSKSFQELKDHIIMQRGSIHNLFSPLHPGDVPFQTNQKSESIPSTEGTLTKANMNNGEKGPESQQSPIEELKLESLYISPVSVTADNAFDDQTERSTKSAAETDNIKRNANDCATDEEIKEHVAADVEEETEKMRAIMKDLEPASAKPFIGIFKPVKSLFKPLTKTLLEPERENVLSHKSCPEVKGTENGMNDWYIDSGEIFADLEADGESLQWEQNMLMRRATGSMKFLDDLRHRQNSQGTSSANLNVVQTESDAQNHGGKSIFGALNSDLAFKLTPLHGTNLGSEENPSVFGYGNQKPC